MGINRKSYLTDCGIVRSKYGKRLKSNPIESHNKPLLFCYFYLFRKLQMMYDLSYYAWGFGQYQIDKQTLQTVREFAKKQVYLDIIKRAKIEGNDALPYEITIANGYDPEIHAPISKKK